MAGVEVDDPAGDAVEPVVGGLVVSRVGVRREQPVAARRLLAQCAAAVASGIVATARVSCTAGE